MALYCDTYTSQLLGLQDVVMMNGETASADTHMTLPRALRFAAAVLRIHALSAVYAACSPSSAPALPSRFCRALPLLPTRYAPSPTPTTYEKDACMRIFCIVKNA